MNQKYIIIISFLLIGEVRAQGSQTSVFNAGISRFFSLEKWGASYSNYMNGPTLSENKEEYSINHYISVNHKFNRDWSASLTFRPDQKAGNRKEEEDSFTQGDSYLTLGLPPFYKKSNRTKVYSQLRYYAPLSESSKNAEIYGKVVPRVYAKSSVNKFDFLYLLIPTIYLNSKKESGQKQFSHGHWLQVNYKLFKDFTLDLAAYPTWTYLSNKNNTFNDMPIYPGVSYSFTDKMSVSTYLEVAALDIDPKTSMIGGSVSYTFF